MALAVVQSVSATGASVTSLTTAGIDTTSGSLLVFDVSAYPPGCIDSVEDNGVLVWQLALSLDTSAATANNSIAQFYSENITGQVGHTFTVNLTEPGYVTIAVKEISGAALSGALDQVATFADNTATSHSSSSTSSLVQADEIACGIGGSDQGPDHVYAATNGFTEDENYDFISGSQTALISASRILAATFVIAFTFTSTQAVGVNAGVATYRAAPVGTTVAIDCSATVAPAAVLKGEATITCEASVLPQTPDDDLPWTLVDSVLASSTNNSDVTSSAIDITPANLLIGALADYIFGTSSIIADNLANTWTQLTERVASFVARARLSYAKDPANVGSDFFTAGPSPSAYSYPSLVGAAFAGADTVDPFDVQNGNAAVNVDHLDTNPVTPTQEDCLIVTMICCAQGVPLTIDSGFKLIRQVTVYTPNAVMIGFAYKVQHGTPTAVNPRWDFGGNVNSGAATCIAAFRSQPATTGTVTITCEALVAPAVQSTVATVAISCEALVQPYATGQGVVGQPVYTPKKNQWIPLLAIAYDDGDRLFAMDGIPGPVQYWEKRVKSIGTITIDSPLLCGMPSMGSVEVVLANHDGYFNHLRAATAWRNRLAYVYFGNVANGASSFKAAWTGAMSKPRFSNDTVSFSINDQSLDKFSRPVGQFLRSINPVTGFPDAVPSYSKPALIPYVLGVVYPPSLDDGVVTVAQMPAYLINAATNTYILGHGVISVPEIFAYGISQGGGAPLTSYSYPVIDGQQYTCISFDGPYVDPTRTAEVELTWWGTGDVSAGTQPMYMAEAMLLKLGFLLTDLDAPSWDRVKAAHVARGFYNQCIVITDANQTVGEVWAHVCKSFGIRSYRTREGKLGVCFIGEDPVASIAFEEYEIQDFVDDDQDDDVLCSVLQYNSDYNFLRDYYARQPDLPNAAEALAIGGNVRDNVSMKFVRSIIDQAGTSTQVADTMAALYMELRSEALRLPSFTVPAEHFGSVDIGGKVLATHSKGVGASGYVGAEVIVLATELSTSPDENRLRIYGYVKTPTTPTNVEIGGTINIGATGVAVIESDVVQLGGTIAIGASGVAVMEAA